jgi:two-component system, LytTR family, sensor kinase
MASWPKHFLRNYAIYFSVWTVFALFFSTQSIAQKFITGEKTPVSHYVVAWLVGCYIFALLTPVVIWLGKRFPFHKNNWLRRGLLHLLFSLVFSVVQLTVEAAILPRLGVFPSIMRTFSVTLVFLAMIGFHQNIFTYWTILAIQYGLDYYHRYQERAKQALRLELNTAELKTQLMNAQLSALKMQLQPHFLFNTLNAIMVLVRQQKGPQAEEMLSRLSDLLRCVLEDVEAQEVTLRRELEYLQLYFSIEQVRFQDRLRVEILSDPAVQDAAVPQMGLQPIVENAIRHGIGRSSTAGQIRITANRICDTLEIKVQDDGPGLDPANLSDGRGIGLSNTVTRLFQLYGNAAKLTIENGAPGGTVVTMILPYRSIAEPSEREVMEIHALHNADR